MKDLKCFLKDNKLHFVICMVVMFIICIALSIIIQHDNHKIYVNSDPVYLVDDMYGIGEVYANRIVQLKPIDGYNNIIEMLDIIEYPNGEKREIFIKHNMSKISFKE